MTVNGVIVAGLCIFYSMPLLPKGEAEAVGDVLNVVDLHLYSSVSLTVLEKADAIFASQTSSLTASGVHARIPTHWLPINNI